MKNVCLKNKKADGFAAAGDDGRIKRRRPPYGRMVSTGAEGRKGAPAGRTGCAGTDGRGEPALSAGQKMQLGPGGKPSAPRAGCAGRAAAFFRFWQLEAAPGRTAPAGTLEDPQPIGPYRCGAGSRSCREKCRFVNCGRSIIDARCPAMGAPASAYPGSAAAREMQGRNTVERRLPSAD